MKMVQAFKPALLALVVLVVCHAGFAGQGRAAGTDPQIAKTGDPWAACRFLLGDWVAVEGSGKPGEAISGAFSFTFDLGDRILVRRNRADFVPSPGEKTGRSHQDLLSIYMPAGEKQLRAFYLDNEGNTINYLVSFPKEGSAVFESDLSVKGPRFRLEHQLNADRTMTIVFSSAPPGGSYQVYTKGTARRK
jgi:hypothetical protein